MRAQLSSEVAFFKGTPKLPNEVRKQGSPFTRILPNESEEARKLMCKLYERKLELRNKPKLKIYEKKELIRLRAVELLFLK